MIEETLSDAERRYLLGLLIDQVPAGEPPSGQLLRLISKLSGTDTEVICRRAYLSLPHDSPAGEPDPLLVPPPLKRYELEAQMTLVRTMEVMAPNEDMARNIAHGWVTLAADGSAELSSVLKWSDGRRAYRPMPVETILLQYELEIYEPNEVSE